MAGVQRFFIRWSTNEDDDHYVSNAFDVNRDDIIDNDFVYDD